MEFAIRIVGRSNGSVVICGILVALLIFPGSHLGFAQQTIKVEFDDVVPGDKHDNADGSATLDDRMFSKDDMPFSSRGWPGGPAQPAVPAGPGGVPPAQPAVPAATPGSKLKNGSHFTINDVHIRLINPDKYGKNYTFDPNSTGGGAFPDKKAGPGVAKADVSPEISPDGTEITFKSGNIPPGGAFWSLIPKSSDIPVGIGAPGVGKGLYRGRLTPTHVQGGGLLEVSGECETVFNNWNIYSTYKTRVRVLRLRLTKETRMCYAILTLIIGISAQSPLDRLA